MGPPEWALSRIPGVPEDHKGPAGGSRVGRKVGVPAEQPQHGQTDGTRRLKTSNGEEIKKRSQKERESMPLTPRVPQLSYDGKRLGLTVLNRSKKDRN